MADQLDLEKAQIHVISKDHPRHAEVDVDPDRRRRQLTSTAFYNSIAAAYNEIDRGDVMVFPISDPTKSISNIVNVLQHRGILRDLDYLLTSSQVDPITGVPLPRGDKVIRIKRLSDTVARMVDVPS